MRVPAVARSLSVRQNRCPRPRRAASIPGSDAPRPSAPGYIGAAPGRGPTPGQNNDPGEDDNRSAPLDGLRVLVVEDEVLVALEVEDTLAEFGAVIVGTAMDAEEAVRLAERERPDVICMDIRLRGQRDGVDAALEIHARFGIRSVFCSAYGEHELSQRAAPADPLGWVRKPIVADDLLAALRSAPRR